MNTQERLKKVLSYDPDTGVFTWLTRPNNSIRVGDIAGCIDSSTGYRVIRVDKVLHYAHRLAWLFISGCLPNEEVDHIDRDRLNNKIENLREATSKQNKANMRVGSRNTSGVKGVSWNKKMGKWSVTANISGRSTNFGCYADKDEAAMIYRNAAIKEHGEYALNV